MEGKASFRSGPCLKCSQGSSKQDRSQCQAYHSDCSAVPRFETAGARGQIPTAYASSFLCFLPETDGSPGLIRSNEIRGNNVQGSFTGASSLGLSIKKNQMNEFPNIVLRSINATTAAYNKVEATLGNGSNLQKIPSEAGSSNVNSSCAKNGGEQHSKAMKADTQGPEAELSRDGNEIFSHQSEHSSDISGHCGPTTEAVEVEDELAFEIAQFFEACQQGNVHLLNRLSRESESLTERASSQADESPSALEPSTLNLPTSEDQLMSDEYRSSNVLRDEGSSYSTILGHGKNAGYPNDFRRNGANNRIRQSSPDDVYSFSGKWYEDVEAADSVSVTFSGPLPLSGPVSFSGHSGQIFHSGSVSHRSDSSTASTHSFAFPILPFEWNSSPVKMAQPDKRYMRQGWRGCLCSWFCCKRSATMFD